MSSEILQSWVWGCLDPYRPYIGSVFYKVGPEPIVMNRLKTPINGRK